VTLVVPSRCSFAHVTAFFHRPTASAASLSQEGGRRGETDRCNNYRDKFHFQYFHIVCVSSTTHLIRLTRQNPSKSYRLFAAQFLSRDSASAGVLSLKQLNSAASAATKDNIMKIQNKFVTVTVTAVAALFITQARAQYRAVGDDGIAASPKLRQQLNERARSTTNPQAAPTVASAGYQAVANNGIAASPKLREMLNEQERNAVVTAPSTAVASAGFRATGVDGITASPKLRAQLNERGSQPFQIAPVK
jgi:hypothetical protein